MLRCPVDLSPLSDLSCRFGHKYREVDGIPDLVPPGRGIPETAEPFERLYERYDKRYERHRVLFENELAAIRALGVDFSNSLEIGVGTGRFASGLGIPRGIDPSLNALRLARLRGISVVRALGEMLPFGRDSFEYSLIAFTICFAERPEELIREAIRVSRRGIIVAFVPRSSPRGEFYESRRYESPFYRVARFRDLEDITGRIEGRADPNYRIYSTLFSDPPQEIPEEPKPGFHEDAGFVALLAEFRKIAFSSPSRPYGSPR